MARYDAIVLGLGAMGSAALYQLAKRGARVLGIDRYDPPHERGSTHGDTRVTRLAIGEGAHYTPLVQRSHEIWRDVERETGADLLTANGGLIVSSAAKASFTHVPGFFDNTIAAAKAHGIAHQMLDTAALRRRFPQLAIRDGEIGYYEPSAGFVRPEACIRAQLDLARKHGAEIHTGERVLSFEESAGAASVTTDRATYAADTVIVAAGPWLPGFLGEALARYFKIYRQALFWFDAGDATEMFLPDRFPIFIWELQQSRQGIYGFPALDGRQGGVKIATEQYAATTSADSPSHEVSPAEIAAMYEAYVAPNIPALTGRCIKAVSCLYTVTPDSQFVIDRHPGMKRVILASPCSGHGFKHSAAIGEALAALATGGESRFDLSPFRLSRLQ
jgi:sarcosine oxidase